MKALRVYPLCLLVACSAGSSGSSAGLTDAASASSGTNLTVKIEGHSVQLLFGSASRFGEKRWITLHSWPSCDDSHGGWSHRREGERGDLAEVTFPWPEQPGTQSLTKTNDGGRFYLLRERSGASERSAIGTVRIDSSTTEVGGYVTGEIDLHSFAEPGASPTSTAVGSFRAQICEERD